MDLRKLRGAGEPTQLEIAQPRGLSGTRVSLAESYRVQAKILSQAKLHTLQAARGMTNAAIKADTQDLVSQLASVIRRITNKLSQTQEERQ